MAQRTRGGRFFPCDNFFGAPFASWDKTHERRIKGFSSDISAWEATMENVVYGRQ